MAMLINTKMFVEGSSDYYDPSFRAVLEAHLPLLRQSARSYRVTVGPNKTIVYNRDLFGFLNEINVDANLHWLVMRMNNFFSSYDFTSPCDSLLMPHSEDVDKLRQSWKTTSVVGT